MNVKIQDLTLLRCTKGTFQGYFADVFKSSLSEEENARSYAEAIAARLGV